MSHNSNTFYLIFWILLIGSQVLAILLKLERWPFSAYPMFANVYPPSQVQVFRIAIIKNDGERVWWKPRFYGYQRDYGHVIAATHLKASPQGSSGKRFAAAFLFKLIELDYDIRDFKAIQLVSRTLDMGAAQGADFKVVEQTLIEIPIPVKRTGDA